jgi:tRNA(Arg) A34 adenosine deaminase TadA
MKMEQAATAEDREFMRRALDEMRRAGVIEKTGGPFGVVIVRDGNIIAAAGNSVTRDSDPTAHAEINAIRAACRKAQSPHLEGTTLYSSCEPCPMCYATAHWARVGRIVYAASWEDYADLFDDGGIARDIGLPYGERYVEVAQFMRDEAKEIWEEFRKLPDGARY